ncbi:MAG TPA: NAD-dependent epimerase/dehydratase family protein [Candidatus Limnocylindria bacterium]|nr:NAD-dependent epimerase/dehydratase family protein [Candidatus Limnocylindria bacterium]
MTVLVTGGSGHLGANLVRRLLDDGVHVRALARRHSDNAGLDGLDVEQVWGDLRDAAAVRAALRGCRRVYHCAAKVSSGEGQVQEIYTSNVVGTRNLLRAALEVGVDRVVVSGSFSAVGHEPGRASDESVPVNPFDRLLPYQRSKVAVEHECLKAAVDGLDVVIATSCAILGPNDFKPSRMGRVLVDFAHGRLRAYIPGSFEFVAARDIVEGHLLAMEKGRTGQKYIFSTAFTTVDELMMLFEKVTGRSRPRLRLPPPLMAGLAEVASFVTTRMRPHAPQRFTPGAVRLLRMDRRADTTKARRELGFTPTSVRDAIAEAYADFARRGLVPAR